MGKPDKTSTAAVNRALTEDCNTKCPGTPVPTRKARPASADPRRRLGHVRRESLVNFQPSTLASIQAKSEVAASASAPGAKK